MGLLVVVIGCFFLNVKKKNFIIFLTMNYLWLYIIRVKYSRGITSLICMKNYISNKIFKKQASCKILLIYSVKIF